MKRDYEKKVATLVAESIGISPSRVTVETDEAKGSVTVRFPTSMLLRGERRDALVAKAQAIVPEPLRVTIA